MPRHDATQVAAERLAEQMGGFSVRHRPGATLSLSEPVLAAVFAKALDAGLITATGKPAASSTPDVYVPVAVDPNRPMRPRR